MTHDIDDQSDGVLNEDGSETLQDGKEKNKVIEVDPNGIESITKERDKAKSDYLYLKAEFDNYKRNAIKERADLLKYGAERVIVDILQVMDNLERALQLDINERNVESFRKGMEMVASEMKTILQRFGVTDVPSEGAAFDPNIHEALTSEETDETPSGHITKVFRKPYKLHDKVIRTGQVVVAREPAN